MTTQEQKARARGGPAGVRMLSLPVRYQKGPRAEAPLLGVGWFADVAQRHTRGKCAWPAEENVKRVSKGPFALGNAGCAARAEIWRQKRAVRARSRPQRQRPQRRNPRKTVRERALQDIGRRLTMQKNRARAGRGSIP